MYLKKTAVLIISGLLTATTLLAQKVPTSTETQRTAKATQNKANPSMLNPTDRAFLRQAAEANLGEIDSAKVVQKKTTDPAMKDFAQRMISDHTQANQKLQALAQRDGLTLPDRPSTTAVTQVTELQKLSGAKLNDAYLNAQLRDHKQVITEFQKEIEQGKDPAVKSYAEQVLPTLQDHIRIAEDVAGKLGLAGKAGLTDEAKAITPR